MLCAKCQKNEATFHLTTILHEKEEETIHLCKHCGPEMTPLPTLAPLKRDLFPFIARKCDICGKEAFSAKKLARGGAIFWCFECHAEYRRALIDLFTSARKRRREVRVLTAPINMGSSDPQQLLGALDEAALNAVQILKERRQGNARDWAS